MIVIDRDSSVPIYKQLYDTLKHEILENDMQGKPLASIRTLAKELCISRNSVDRAYQQLLAEGYIYARQGSGYYCNAVEPERAARAGGAAASVPAREAPPPRYNFEYVDTDNRLFPWTNWRKCLREAIYYEESARQLVYGDRQGYYELRRELATFTKKTRGVNCRPEQIIMCCGVQHAIDILGAVLPSDEYVLGFEEPGYDGTRNAFLRHRYPLRPIAVGDQGMNLDELVDSDCNLVFVTPSHQFPLGGIMPIANRYRLLSLMNERDGYIVEDDYDSEFRYGTMAIPSLQSLDTADRVIYIGTFSKIFSPTLRAAYLVLPNRLLDIYRARFQNAKPALAGFLQRALYDFIKAGYYARHLRRLVLLNEKRLAAIKQAFQEHPCPAITPITTNSGVHLLLRIRTPGLSQAALLSLLEANEIRLYTIAHCWYLPEHREPDLYLMGFSSIDLHDLREGVRRLCEVVGGLA